MLPITNSGTYETHQYIDWEVNWYDSSMTVPEAGIRFTLGTPASTFTHAGMRDDADPEDYMENNAAPVLTTNGSDWVWGRSPLVHEYWESGAPIGVTTARKAVLHWQGSVPADRSWLEGTEKFWLGFCGSGSIRVIYDSVEVLNTTLSHSEVSYTDLLDGVEDDLVDIYYWQLGEAWGGVVGKYVPQPTAPDADPTLAGYQEAPVISSSLFPYEAAEAAVTLPDVTKASLNINGPNEATSMTFSIPLRTAADTVGWTILNSPRRLKYENGGTTHTLKRYQLIELKGGFQDELYDRFTGYLDNFQERDGVAVVECLSTDSRLSAVHVENFPDRMSYMTFGYFNTDVTSEPVQDIPAYDGWPLEYVVKDLCYRGGIDSKRFYGVRQFNDEGVLTDKEDLFNDIKSGLFTAKTWARALLKLQRQARYGNSGLGFNEHKQPDDEYIYAPNVAGSVNDWIRTLADGVGYDFRTDGAGDLVLSSRNTPHRVSTIDAGAEVFNAAAYGGSYRNITSGFTATNRVYASRIDLAVGRQTDLDVVDYSVKYGDGVNSGTVVAAGTLDLALAGEANGVFVYDDRFTLDGDNAAIVSLYSGDWGVYVVELSDNSGSQWWLDTLLLYDYDPATSNFLEVFKTDKAVLSLLTDSQATDARNRVVVVGKRKAAVTDSAKFRNPNNPADEFYVSVGADPASIWTPTADNYVGTKLSVVIADERIADQDYADWVAQTLLVRQRAPDPAPEFGHTLIPIVEPRDPIQVSDEQFGTITSAVDAWVVGFSEEYTLKSATSKIRATSYAEIPSYEPRADVSIDDLDTNFAGSAAVNVSISYTSLDDVVVTDPGPNIPSLYTVEERADLTVSSNGNGDYVDASGLTAWPPIPGSVRLHPNRIPEVNPQTLYHNQSFIGPLKNNPYFKFWHLYSTDYDDDQIHIPCLTGDGGVAYGRGPWGIGGDTIEVSYRGLDRADDKADVYGGECPFYDPYTSELADSNLVTLTFDAIISGYYRISIWAKDTAGGDPIRVAWLTSPGVDEDEPEAHWEFVQGGNDKTYLWDGVDNIGDWNKAQSEDYSWLARGVFEQDQKPAIGKGFYAWNNHNSELVTISGQRDETTDALVFEDDHYSQFYVEIETKNALLADTAEPIRSTRSDQLVTTGGLNTQEEIYIYTYLPPPTKVRISAIEDWDMSYGSWSEGEEDGWTASPDSGATIRNDKPIRLTYEALARPGELFVEDRTSFKLNRLVHLNANIMDMFLIYEGRDWLADTSPERKRLVCRKVTNAENTVNFADTDFRLGGTLSDNKWVFVPQDFKINDQPLEYNDYLQLEDVPEFNRNRTLGGTASRYLMGYINYLFYLSAYAQDRSGRMVWAIDESFVDKAKLPTSTFTTEFPEDLEEYFNRTIVTRQWNDPAYRADMISKWSIPTNSQKYLQFFWRRLEPNDTDAGEVLYLDAAGDDVTGDLDTAYVDEWSTNLESVGRLPADFIMERQLGDWTNDSTYNIDFFGDWEWEGSTADDTVGSADKDPLWIPAPTRDWHGYYLTPPMPVQTQDNDPVDSYWYSQVQVDGDKDSAAGEVWFSRSPGMNVTHPGPALVRSFYPGHSVEELTRSSQMFGGIFEYTRQDELRHWEDYRGMVTGGPLQDGERERKTIQASAEPYLMNWYRYDEIDYVLEVQDRGSNTPSLLWAGYTEVAIADRPSESISSWFEATFRHQYNWESAGHFPVHRVTGRLHPEFLNLKYDPQPKPAWLSFDDGAWAGWKDDSGGSLLRWKANNDGYATAGGEGHGEKNIFLQNPQGPFYAVGPETDEKKNMIMSLVLLNNRRKQPV